MNSARLIFPNSIVINFRYGESFAAPKLARVKNLTQFVQLSTAAHYNSLGEFPLGVHSTQPAIARWDSQRAAQFSISRGFTAEIMLCSMGVGEKGKFQSG